MNILRWNRKSKNKIKPKTLLLLIFSLIMTTFAWFAYSKVLEPTLNIHMASWDITYEIDGVEKKNPVEVEFDVLYPTMPTQTVVIDIFNNGETLVDIEHQVKSLKIAGNEYQIVYEGGTIPSENYIVVTPSVLTTVEKTVETEDEATGQITTTTVTEQVYKGVVTNDITRFPFTIEIEHSSQVLPVTEDEYGTTIPGQGYLKVTVNWVGDHNDLDSEWGFIVGDYLANNPGESAMSVELSIDSYQANPNAEDEVVETIMPSTSTTRPYLPDGFTRIPGTSLATGLAITDDSGNEYVWVEVPRATSVYQNAGIKITEFSSDDANGAYSKIEADLRAYVGDYSDRADAYTSSDALGFNPTNYTALKQKMLKSIYNHGGFYIGRYEAGVESGIRTKASDALVPAVIKSNAYPYNYVTSSQAHSLATALAPTGYTSGLMFGLQWDLVMKYLETKSAQFVSTDEKAAAIADMQYKLKSDSTSWGNFTNNSYSLTNANVQYMKEADLAAGWLTTWREETVEGETVLIASPYEKDEDETVLITSGGNSSFCNQNIYDIAGNLSEWTYNVVYADGAYRGGNGGNYTLNGGASEDDALAIAGAGAGETSNFATANSYGSYNVMAGAKEVGFRVALLSDSDVTEPWGDNDCPITKISLDKTSDETEVGKSLTITATTNAGAVGDIIWESSDERIAIVTGSGTNLTTATVTGVAKGGPITITARNEEGTAVATCEVTVRQYITGITLNPTTADVKIGETFSITATIDEGAEDNLIWESSNTSVATVTGSGNNNTTATVTGVSKGTATITAKNADGTVSATCAVTVHQYITFINLNKTSETITKGNTTTITATVDTGAEDNLTWTSSNTSVATVAASGTNLTTATVTGVAGGTATITAKNSSGSVVKTCIVTVNVPTITFKISNESFTVEEGTTWAQFSSSESRITKLGDEVCWSGGFMLTGGNATGWYVEKWNDVIVDGRTYFPWAGV